MNKPFLALAALLTPISISIQQVQAESWKDWVKSNPTYNSPASASPNSPSSPKATNQAPTQTLPTPPPAASQNNTPPTVSIPQTNNKQYLSTHNPLFEQQFMAGCQADGLPISYCQCTLKEVQNNYTFDEVLTIVNFMQDNSEIPTELLDVAMKCLPG